MSHDGPEAPGLPRHKGEDGFACLLLARLCVRSLMAKALLNNTASIALPRNTHHFARALHRLASKEPVRSV